jgi:uncharacterized protein (DUF58 family)
MTNRRNAIYSLILLCVGGGLFTGRPFFFSMAYMFAALLIFALVWSWATMRGVGLSRQTQTRRTQVGKIFDEQFTVRNNALLPKIWLEVRDHSTLPGHNASSVTSTLLPRQSYQWFIRTLCVVRGQFTLGPLTIIGGDPFGLYQVTRRIGATSQVLVYPAAAPLFNFAPPTGVLSGGDARRQRAAFVTTNAAGVREYVPGDSLNRVHWRTSARKGKLMVKEFELDPLAETWVLLDLAGVARYYRPYSIDSSYISSSFLPPDSAEYAIAVAASLAGYFLEKEQALGFAAYTPQRFFLQPDRGSRQQMRILEALALAQTEAEITFAQLIALEGYQLGRGVTAVLVTASPAEDWIRETHLLARRGVRTLAVLLDPYSFNATECRAHNVRPVLETQVLLEQGGVQTYIVRDGDNLTDALSSQTLHRGR